MSKEIDMEVKQKWMKDQSVTYLKVGKIHIGWITHEVIISASIMKYYMPTATHAIIWDLVWKMINEQFPASEIKEKIEALPLSVHDADLEMEPRHHMPGELERVTTI